MTWFLENTRFWTDTEIDWGKGGISQDWESSLRVSEVSGYGLERLSAARMPQSSLQECFYNASRKSMPTYFNPSWESTRFSQSVQSIATNSAIGPSFFFSSLA